MRILLDTHAFLWVITDDPRLSKTAADAFLDEDNQILLSVTSVWEMAIKAAVGKLELDVPLDELVHTQLRTLGIQLQSIELAHVLGVRAMPFHHRDPFDRLLVSQALAEGLVLMSRDPALDAYGITRLW
jgi:PIN domain nuclease of toxin-antitoxin system